jgi:hypothetical protein
MRTSRVAPFLRWALFADAAASGGTGLLMLLFSRPLEGLLHLPADLLFNAGLLLVPYAGLIAFLGTRAMVPNWAVWAVIGANVLWAIDSMLLLAGSWVAPSVLGYAFVIGQAAVVALFAELQFMGLRRSTLVSA